MSLYVRMLLYALAFSISQLGESLWKPLSGVSFLHEFKVHGIGEQMVLSADVELEL